MFKSVSKAQKGINAEFQLFMFRWGGWLTGNGSPPKKRENILAPRLMLNFIA